MQLQPADPHDAIAAQLRDLAPRRAPDTPELDDKPAASPESAAEPSLRAAPLNDNTGDVRILTPRRRSGGVVVLLAVCVGVAATMAWHAYGDETKQRLSSFMPQLLANMPQLFANAPAPQSAAAEPKDVASQAVASQTAATPPASDSAPAQDNSEPATPTPSATSPAPAAPAAETPPVQAAVPPELMQSIEAMTREIDALKQTVQQLQAGQQQLSQDIAKVGEHRTRHKAAAEQTSKPASRPRPRHASTPAVDSRTVARYSPPPAPSQRQTYPRGAVQHDAYIPPPAPARLPPPPGDSSAPRPPMPLQ